MDNTQPTQVPDPAPAEATVLSLSGFNEGDKLPDGSIVRGDFDQAGKVIGWHKEAPATEEQI